jgi:multiple sugar transport system permease protein
MKVISKSFVIVFCFAALTPIAWHLVTPLKTASELTAVPPTLVPHDPTLVNYTGLFQRRPFFRYYINSFTIAAMSSLLCVVAASLAAYRLARGEDARGWLSVRRFSVWHFSLRLFSYFL